MNSSLKCINLSIFITTLETCSVVFLLFIHFNIFFVNALLFINSISKVIYCKYNDIIFL